MRTTYGPPGVVHITDVPAPEVGPGDVRVAVHSTTVNRTDCGIRAAKPFFIRGFTGLVRPRATILGNEFAGVVESVGQRVTRFSTGDRVFGYSRQFGAHAELVSVPEDGLIADIPPGLSFEDVAPGTEGAHYALSIIRKAGISSGQDVLLNGATGAIGSAAVQLLADLGVGVTAVCGTDHVDLVRGLGANRVIDRDVVDFTQEDHQYDVVFDAVGEELDRTVPPGTEAARPVPDDRPRTLGPEPRPADRDASDPWSAGHAAPADREPGDRRVPA